MVQGERSREDQAGGAALADEGRLEKALDRIATAAAAARPEPVAAAPDAATTALIAERLDALIAELRSALAEQAE